MGRFGSSKHSSVVLSSALEDDEEQPTTVKRATVKNIPKKTRFIKTSKLLSINTIGNLVKLQEKIQQTNKKGLP